MKKLLLSAVIAVFGLTGLKAQSTGLEGEAFLGLPMGDASDGASLNLGINLAYYWDVAEGFKVGALAGFDHWISKKVDGEKGKDISYLPIAATAKYSFDQFYVGLDLGFALGLTSEKESFEVYGYSFSAETKSKGGFLFRPRFGYSTSSFDIFAFYKGMSDKVEATINDSDGNESFSETISMGSLGVGFTYKF